MTIRTVDLSGRYEISAVAAGRITLTTPGQLNPAWFVADLAGAGTTGYAQNITMIRSNSDTAVDLAGTYQIAAVTADQVTLTDPGGVNPDWGVLASYAGGTTVPLSAFMTLTGETNWIGPYIIDDPETAFLVVNVVAEQGAYKVDQDAQYAANVEFEVVATPVDEAGLPIGPAQTFVGTVLGSDTTKEMRALTLVCPLGTPGRQSVQAKRVTNQDYDFKGTVVDEIKWQDLYGMGPVDQPDFGNVTTVRTRTFATQGALNAKERKLNMLVTRRVPHWTGVGTVFDPEAGSKSAADIFVEVCQDPVLGNRDISELDLASIYGAVADAVGYFGEAEAGQFCYTFDNDQTSFEEMAIAIAGAAFSVPYRQGSDIKLFFEGATPDSTMLFNHRNKVPGSETRTVRFGPMLDNDGIELEYVNPDDDTPATIYIPADKSAKKPQKITAQGVRSKKQAYWLAWRAYNKMFYQHTSAEFTALQEAAPLVLSERILIADNTRPDTQDGEVAAQVGLQLTLSQDVDLSSPGGHTIFLQLTDATIDAIPIVAGAESNQVVLSRAPRVALALDPNLYAQTIYQIVPNSGGRSSAFLLTEKRPEDNGGFSLQAVNYTGLYYINDSLQLWLAFLAANYDDSSPYARDGTPASGSATVMDATRGKNVHSGDDTSFVAFPDFNPPATSYSKAAWVKPTDRMSASLILEGDSGATESFRVSGGLLSAGHSGVMDVSAAYPADGLWHHVAVTYDWPTEEMVLYLDGEVVGSIVGVGNRAMHQLLAFQSLGGRADDLRLWARVLAPDDVRDLYRATQG